MHKPAIRRAVLVALTIFFGLQAYRVFLPKVIWYLGQYIAAEQMALLAMLIFATSLLTPVLRKFLSERLTLTITAGGLALVYLGMCLADSAMLYLVLSILGLILLGWFLPFWQTSPRNRPGEMHLPVLASAFPLAFLLDTGLRSLLWSYDLVWRHDLASRIGVLFMVILALALLWLELTGETVEDSRKEPLLSRALPIMGLGAFLYLAMSMLHNPFVLAMMTGWSDLNAYLLVNLLAILGAFICPLAAARPPRQRIALTIMVSLGLATVLWTIYTQVSSPAVWFGLAMLGTWALLGWLLSVTGAAPTVKPGLWRTSLGIFFALLIMLVIIFLVAQFEMYFMTVAAGLLLSLSTIWAVFGARNEPSPLITNTVRVLGSAAGLMIILLAVWFFTNRPYPMSTPPTPNANLRVMTYNIHQGIDADMKIDLEAIARAIQTEKPDVVALNEVNRGRATNGFIDVLAYLSSRLDMPYVFGANYADGQYGNALLSRYPILSWENKHYQTNTTEVRGLLRVEIATASQSIIFFSTHLDHIASPDNARAAQVGEMLTYWDDSPRVVILGDLNATPRTPEIQLIVQAGFIDLLAANHLDQAFTFWDSPPAPGRRIDYIFVTPDLPYGAVSVPETRASDHLPVIAIIGP